MLALIVAGLLVIPVGWIWRPLAPNQIPVLIYLAVVTQAAALAPIRLSRGSHYLFTVSLVATGLVAPGPGVALLCWIATNDGRVPGRDAPVWRLATARANFALSHGIPSILLALLPLDSWIGIPALALPIRTLLYSLAVIAINYSLTAKMFAIVNGTRALDELRDNVAWPAIQSMLLLGMAGGALYMLLQKGGLSGAIMGVALLGSLVLARANLAYAQAQIQARIQTLELVAQTLDARDAYTESHSQRVAALAVELGRVLGMRQQALEELRTAGSLHDIGKIGIPDAVLNKPGQLDQSEWDLMRGHAARGAQMISVYSHLAPVVPIVRSHHERWDGSGYPDGLRGQTIPLGARILAVADSFDTVTSPRIYRPSSMTELAAVNDITARSGVWYDPAVVQALRIAKLIDRPEAPEVRGAIVAARRNPGLIRLLAGASISSLGDPLTMVAALVLLYGVSHQAFLVAAAYIARALGTLFVGALAAALPDRLNRRTLIIVVESLRACLLLAAPAYILLGPIPVLVLMAILGGGTALVQPARQAAVAKLVRESDLQTANGLLSSAVTVANMVGFPIAGGILILGASPLLLFILDAATFLFAAVATIGLGDLGGGVPSRRWWSGIGAGWSIRSARPHVVLAAATAGCVGLTLPTLVTLAFDFWPHAGGVAYTLLELSLGAGAAVGGLLVARIPSRTPWKTAAGGLLLMGLGSVLLALSPTLPAGLVFLFGASLGNPMWVAGNQTALQTAGDNRLLGSVLATRFVLGQTTLLIGSAAAGILISTVGPRATYGIVGLILLMLASGAALWLSGRTGVEVRAAEPEAGIAVSTP